MTIVNGTNGNDVIHGTETAGLSLNNGETDQYAEIAKESLNKALISVL